MLIENYSDRGQQIQTRHKKSENQARKQEIEPPVLYKSNLENHPWNLTSGMSHCMYGNLKYSKEEQSQIQWFEIWCYRMEISCENRIINGRENCQEFAYSLYFPIIVILLLSDRKVLETWSKHHAFVNVLRIFNLTIGEFTFKININFHQSANFIEQIIPLLPHPNTVICNL